MLIGDLSNPFKEGLPGITPWKPYHDEYNPKVDKKTDTKKQK